MDLFWLFIEVEVEEINVVFDELYGKLLKFGDKVEFAVVFELMFVFVIVEFVAVYPDKIDVDVDVGVYVDIKISETLSIIGPYDKKGKKNPEE